MFGYIIKFYKMLNIDLLKKYQFYKTLGSCKLIKKKKENEVY